MPLSPLLKLGGSIISTATTLVVATDPPISRLAAICGLSPIALSKLYGLLRTVNAVRHLADSVCRYSTVANSLSRHALILL